MSIFVTVVIAALVAVAFVAAMRYSLKHNTSCADCVGGDPGCTLGKCETSRDHADAVRQQRLEAMWDEASSSEGR